MMGIDHIQDFPLPSKPTLGSIIAAEKHLQLMGALVSRDNGKEILVITSLGMRMTTYPLAPQWSRMVVLATEDSLHSKQMLCIVLAYASSLSVGDPFIESSARKPISEKSYGDTIDVLKLFLLYHHSDQRKRLCDDMNALEKVSLLEILNLC